MKPKLLKTEAEYEMALAHLESLMDAEAGSFEEEELELFAMLIDEYESEKFPIELPDPIDAILFRMDQEGLKQKDLVKYIGSQSKVSEVLNRKRSLSLSMIRKLHRGLGIPAEVLLQEEGSELSAPCEGLENYPFNEMYKRGYFSFFNGALAEAKEMKEELLTRFFSIFQGMTFTKAIPRASDVHNMDEFALEAWQARALTLAEDEEYPPYQPGSLSENDFKYLVSLSAFANGPLLAREYLQKHGIPFVILKSLPKTYLDGACFKAPSGRPVIALTLRHDRLDNFWFTLLHELAHLFLHLDENNFAFFDETESPLTESELHDPKEKEANDLASKMLIPENEWKFWRSALGKYISFADIDSFAHHLGVAPAIVAGRLRWETGDYKKYSRMLGRNTVKKLFQEN
jgi:HTH-type transcriptional regulator / antitoxin HigA